MTITISAWIIPTIITIVAFIWAFEGDHNGNYDFTILFTAPVALCISLASWLVWAVLT